MRLLLLQRVCARLHGWQGLSEGRIMVGVLVGRQLSLSLVCASTKCTLGYSGNIIVVGNAPNSRRCFGSGKCRACGSKPGMPESG